MSFVSSAIFLFSILVGFITDVGTIPANPDPKSYISDEFMKRVAADPKLRAFATEFPGLYGLYEKVKEMPTHEARRALKRNEVMKMDLERSGYEAELEAQILEDVARLKDFQLSR
mgnify:CR=1 FL=1